MVITTAPGEEGQVDYGSGPMVRDPHSGRYRRTRLFAFTLGYSRKSVRLLVWRSTTQTESASQGPITASYRTRPPLDSFSRYAR